MKEKQINIPVYVDGQLSNDYTPSHVEALQSFVIAKLGNVASHAVLQARLALFDLRMGTNYRSIRNDLVREQKLREWEASIGLKRQGTVR